MTDRELLTAYANGRDPQYLGLFVARYQADVLRFATRLLGDGEAAQDVAQETFIEVARAPRRLLSIDSYRAWLLKVARNVGIDHMRRNARQHKHAVAAGTQAAREEGAAASGPAEVIVQREQRERMYEEIARLPARQRELLLLRVQEGLSYKEIAEVAGLTATNVGFILHQALKELTRRLRDRDEV